MTALFRAIADAVTSIAVKSKDASIDLAKIQAATAYLKGVKGARQAALGAVHAVFGLMILSGLFLVLEMSLLFYLPAGVPVRIAAAAAAAIGFWGIFYAAAIALLSEKRWMRWTKSDKVVRGAVSNGFHSVN